MAPLYEVISFSQPRGSSFPERNALNNPQGDKHSEIFALQSLFNQPSKLSNIFISILSLLF